jgi:Na+-driven multidrug efflux pump
MYVWMCSLACIVNISFPSCISLIAVSLSFVAVSIFFFSYSISVIAVYPLILSKDLNYCLGLGLKGSDYDD